MNIHERHLARNAAHFVALSPVSFVERGAEVFGDLPAVVHGARRYRWAQCRERSARLAAARRRVQQCQRRERANSASAIE